MKLKDFQEKLGCPGCFFCDEKAHRKSEPCCTKMGELKGSSGKCLSRKDPKK